MSRTLNVACLQTRPMPDFTSALGEAIGLAEVAAGVDAEFLLLPEYCGGLRTRGKAFTPPAEPEESHPVLLGLREFALARQVWVSIGSVAVPGPDGKILNRSFIVDDHGEIRARYDKLHLFDIDLDDNRQYRESDQVAAGRESVLVDTRFGCLGLSICYDLRFPDLYRELAQAGAEILLVPAAFTRATGQAHWHVLNRARAIENGAFVLSACAIGPVDGGGESYGHSLIIDPWGEVLADGGELPGVVHTSIDLEKVAEVRNRIPSLRGDVPHTLCNSNDRNVA